MKRLLGLACIGFGLLVGSEVHATATPAPTVDPLPMRIIYQKYGFPGPWWRDQATSPDFESDLKVCRTQSKAARKTAPNGASPSEVAYRSFLECMEGLRWTRGFPPARDTASP